METDMLSDSIILKYAVAYLFTIIINVTDTKLFYISTVQWAKFENCRAKIVCPWSAPINSFAFDL